MAGTESPSLRDWRQGSVLSESAARGFIPASIGDSDPHCVVLISHDCDIVNVEKETEAEVIVGRFVDAVDGGLTGGKNSRTLHLSWSQSDRIRHVELSATKKRYIPKSALTISLPDTSYKLDQDNLATLRFWLAARYNRAAFPDEFNNRLKSTRVLDDLVRILKPLGYLITGVYVRLDTQEELPGEHPTPPYCVTMFVVFAPGEEPLESLERAEKAADAIADAIGSRCYDKAADRWNWLQLDQCLAISEDDLTVGHAKKLQQLWLEYLSLRTSPQGVTPFGAVIR
jgi:hypothetical protein